MSEALLRWGIIGSGRMARQFAAALDHSKLGRLAAVSTRAESPAFIPEFRLARMHHGHEALLDDPDVQAVYIATPHPTHAEFAIKAASRGKHILCEKPLAMNAAEAVAVTQAALRHDVFLMEAFMYRVQPQTLRIIELLRDGAIGQPRLIQASFGYEKPFDPHSRYYAPELGGGGILDVGGYCTSMVRLIAGVANNLPFCEPETVQGGAILGRSGVDELAVATLRFPGGLLAQISVSVALAQENIVRITGSERQLEVRSPWFCSGKQGGRSSLLLRDLRSLDGPVEEIAVETPDWLYAIEADAAATAINQRQPGSTGAGREVAWPGMSWADTLGNMRTLDLWRQQVGLAPLPVPVEESR